MGGGFAERFDDAFSRVSSKMSAFEAFQRLVYMTAYETATACGQETSGFRDIAKAARSASEGQMEDFAECLAWYWAAIEEEPFQDFLGSAYMRLGIGNEAGGQFFTPYHICKLMAEVEVGGMDLDKDVITVSEPSCGAGANCIALCGELHGLGVDWQRRVLFECQDVSEMTALMCYVQLSFIGAASKVTVGDTLLMERRYTLRTPVMCAEPRWVLGTVRGEW